MRIRKLLEPEFFSNEYEALQILIIDIQSVLTVNRGTNLPCFDFFSSLGYKYRVFETLGDVKNILELEKKLYSSCMLVNH